MHSKKKKKSRSHHRRKQQRNSRFYTDFYHSPILIIERRNKTRTFVRSVRTAHAAKKGTQGPSSLPLLLRRGFCQTPPLLHPLRLVARPKLTAALPNSSPRPFSQGQHSSRSIARGSGTRRAYERKRERKLWALWPLLVAKPLQKSSAFGPPVRIVFKTIAEDEGGALAERRENGYGGVQKSS